MRNITVYMNPLELNDGSEVNWDQSQFELSDANKISITTLPGTGTPPDHVMFTDLDDAKNYYYRARGHDTQYEWSPWSDYCLIAKIS